MAKKSGSSRETAKRAKSSSKKTTKKAAARSSRSTKKVTKKKPAAKKTAKKVAKKTTKKATKKTAKKAAKKTTKKSTAKKAAKKTTKKITKKAAPKKKVTKKAASTKASNAASKKKPVRKGITIVSNKPTRKKAASKPVSQFPPTGERLLGPGSPRRKPLIPSGPKAAPTSSLDESAAQSGSRKKKSPYTKRQLDKFKAILLRKRAELLGDVSQMESGALKSGSGNLSHTPQHLAEQGSDNYDQTLSLDLVAADRRLIREIDAALQRIEDRTYGLCELSGKAIRPERLEELPWARYSIEAARELERRGPSSL